MSTTQELIERIQRAAHWAVSENDHFEPELGLEAAARLSELSAELDALRGKLAGVDEVLAPFAALAAELRPEIDDEEIVTSGLGDDPAAVTVGDFRRARATRAAIAAYLAAVGEKP